MFLKCFIHSGVCVLWTDMSCAMVDSIALAAAGRVHVHPILLPVVNYTPEDTTWVKTVWARWVQVIAAVPTALVTDGLCLRWGRDTRPSGMRWASLRWCICWPCFHRVAALSPCTLVPWLRCVHA
jgi:hypothetical protein